VASGEDPNSIISDNYKKVYVNDFATRDNGVEATMYGATIEVTGQDKLGNSEARKIAVISNYRSRDKMIANNVDIDLLAEFKFKIHQYKDGFDDIDTTLSDTSLNSWRASWGSKGIYMNTELMKWARWNEGHYETHCDYHNENSKWDWDNIV